MISAQTITLTNEDGSEKYTIKQGAFFNQDTHYVYEGPICIGVIYKHRKDAKRYYIARNTIQTGQVGGKHNSVTDAAKAIYEDYKAKSK